MVSRHLYSQEQIIRHICVFDAWNMKFLMDGSRRLRQNASYMIYNIRVARFSIIYRVLLTMKYLLVMTPRDFSLCGVTILMNSHTL